MRLVVQGASDPRDTRRINVCQRGASATRARRGFTARRQRAEAGQ
jgi:hypothetical protein